MVVYVTLKDQKYQHSRPAGQDEQTQQLLSYFNLGRECSDPGFEISQTNKHCSESVSLVFKRQVNLHMVCKTKNGDVYNYICIRNIVKHVKRITIILQKGLSQNCPVILKCTCVSYQSPNLKMLT